jgi:hypothetical protein
MAVLGVGTKPQAIASVVRPSIGGNANCFRRVMGALSAKRHPPGRYVMMALGDRHYLHGVSWRTPLLPGRVRWGARPGHTTFLDLLQHETRVHALNADEMRAATTLKPR